MQEILTFVIFLYIKSHDIYLGQKSWKTMPLYVIREFDPWRSPLCTCPSKYSFQPYTGCSHSCLYCYARSYISRFTRRSFISRPKQNLIERLLHDIRIIDKSKPINMSTSSDPYPPEEKKFLVTRKSLSILLRHGCKVLVTTKSNLVVRDIDIIYNKPVAVMITITTLDDNLARKIEPGAPPPSERISAVQKLAENNIPVGVRIDPIIPYLNDDLEMLKELVKEVISAGARHIVTSTYKADRVSFKQLIKVFPEYEGKWRKLYFEDGEKIGRYYYLSQDLRKKFLSIIIKKADNYGITYATCREGLPLRKSPSCDGSHLILSQTIRA